jgi:hypothetical protein
MAVRYVFQMAVRYDFQNLHEFEFLVCKNVNHLATLTKMFLCI